MLYSGIILPWNVSIMCSQNANPKYQPYMFMLCYAMRCNIMFVIHDKENALTFMYVYIKPECTNDKYIEGGRERECWCIIANGDVARAFIFFFFEFAILWFFLFFVVAIVVIVVVLILFCFFSSHFYFWPTHWVHFFCTKNAFFSLMTFSGNNGSR